MSSTAFDRLQPGQAKSVYSFNEFCYTCRLYVMLHRGKRALSISPIDDDFEESTGHSFDKRGSIQMTSSLQYVAVYLSGTKNILSIFSIYHIT